MKTKDRRRRCDLTGYLAFVHEQFPKNPEKEKESDLFLYHHLRKSHTLINVPQWILAMEVSA